MKALFDQLTLKCSKLTTNSYSTSFSLGIKFLDKSIHDEIYAIYGFVRFADEIVDSFHSYSKKQLLVDFRTETFTAIERHISLNPILNSFQWVINKYKIDLELINCFLDSMFMDLEDKVYDRELYEKYILGSAQVVGLMCLKVFVNGDEEQYQALKPYAMSLGAAFQKINFLRDYAQDYGELGRIYFPQLQDLSFNLETKRDIIEEIESDFAHAYNGIKSLPKNSRFGVYVAYSYYLDLLHKIKKSSIHHIKSNRIRISNFRKIYLAIKAFFKFNFIGQEKLIVTALLLFLSFSPVWSYSAEPAIRNAYIDCDKDKNTSENFYKLVGNSDLENNTNKAYLAAANMVESKFKKNPFSKMKLFMDARADLEKLINLEPENLEMRYIRLTVQRATPIFLSYKDNINEDLDLLKAHLLNPGNQGDFEDNLRKYFDREDL